MANLITHYKERSPIETVNIIKKFFADNGYQLKQTVSKQTEAGTWYCHVDVYKGDILFKGAHGKGMTEEYALASGYAELYERFCNKIFYLANPCWAKTFMKKNKTNNGYYFSPDERMMTYDEVINYKATNKYFSKLADGRPELIKSLIDFVTEGTYVGAPMYNITDKDDILYMDPRILLRLQRSNGMAAGNTLEEALVQAGSELIERYVSNLVLFRDMEIKTFYTINLDNIKNEGLKEKINNIKAAGYELRLIDLSYNYGLPVMMSLLLDRDQGLVKMNFGSFPVFEIAAERVLTELYQGINTFHDPGFISELQRPYRITTEAEMREEYGNSISGIILSANFIKNLDTVETYNSKVFIDEHKGNEQLLDYFKEVEKKFNIKFYYLNNSLSKDIYAIHLLMDPQDDNFIFEQALDGHDYSKNDIEVQRCISAIDTLRDLYNNLYESKNINIPKLINLLLDMTDELVISGIVGNTLLWNSVNIVSRDESGFGLLLLLLNPLENRFYEVPYVLMNSELYYSFKKYLQLISYVQTGLYKKEEILNIFNNIFNYNITEEDIMKCTSPAYLLQKVYVEPFTEYIHSDAFYELINTYTNPN